MFCDVHLSSDREQVKSGPVRRTIYWPVDFDFLCDSEPEVPTATPAPIAAAPNTAAPAPTKGAGPPHPAAAGGSQALPGCAVATAGDVVETPQFRHMPSGPT